ncbi:Integral membrane protein 2C [Frankliniella fusca]|uniref:Integral membrane protein 2C n=1 Tax=Frankliniella fusca TaxID=407009 RepID=A0AAE1LWE4_9NEOP|nr:Integral membrane protein 2C [Frankliniella fusca]
MNDLEKESDVMENIIQGALWKNDIKPKFADKIVFPINLSYDDFETNKDLGSHTVVHKLGACHVQIASLPPIFQSVLENLFLCVLFYCSDRAFGLEEIFYPLMEDLKSLESQGIEVTIDNEVKRVYFALCLILGDNLGMNTILGLVECFRANYFCSICKVHREVTEHLCVERADKIRTAANYESDCRRNDFTSTGIKTRCIWNDLECFSITNNIYADIMHDIIEGVGDYDMCFIIEVLVLKKKYFTWEELNDLVQGFFYGEQEFGNKPPLITKEHVMEKESLGFSGTEMLCFIRFFSLMVGFKVTDKNSSIWTLYLNLRELVDLLFAPTFARSDIERLNDLIRVHHELYLSLSGRPLRPKFHKLLHYGRIIHKIGPLKPIWAMRWEAKYKEYRQSANVTSCRKHIAYTLAVKQSLKTCSRFLCKKGLERRFTFSALCQTIPVNSLDDYVNFECKLPPEEKNAQWTIAKWVKVDGTLYKPGMVIIFGLSDLFPQFGTIETISVADHRVARFLVRELKTLAFDSLLHAYHVQEDESWQAWNFVEQVHLICHTPAHKRLCGDGKTYVMLRYPI